MMRRPALRATCARMSRTSAPLCAFHEVYAPARLRRGREDHAQYDLFEAHVGHVDGRVRRADVAVARVQPLRMWVFRFLWTQSGQ